MPMEINSDWNVEGLHCQYALYVWLMFDSSNDRHLTDKHDVDVFCLSPCPIYRPRSPSKLSVTRLGPLIRDHWSCCSTRA